LALAALALAALALAALALVVFGAYDSYPTCMPFFTVKRNAFATYHTNMTHENRTLRMNIECFLVVEFG